MYLIILLYLRAAPLLPPRQPSTLSLAWMNLVMLRIPFWHLPRSPLSLLKLWINATEPSMHGPWIVYNNKFNVCGTSPPISTDHHTPNTSPQTSPFTTALLQSLVLLVMRWCRWLHYRANYLHHLLFPYFADTPRRRSDRAVLTSRLSV